MVGRVMRPHQLGVVGAMQRLDARMHHQPLGDVSLNRLRYGAHVEIRPGPLEDFFLVQMPLSGSARISSGPQQVDSTPDVASVVSPDDDLAMRWSDDSDQFMLVWPAPCWSARWWANWAVRWIGRCASSWDSGGATARPGAA